MARPGASEVDQFLIAFRYQLQFYLRTWRFLGLLAFTLVVSVAFLAFEIYQGVAATTHDTTVGGYLSAYLSNIGTAAILGAAFLGGDAIATDFGTSSGYFMLVQPIRRIVLLFGRFAAAFAAAILISLAYVVLALGGAAYFYGVAAIPGAHVLLAVGLLAFFLVGALSFAFCFSALFRSPASAMIVTVLVLYLGLLFVDAAVALAGIEPSFSIAYAGQTIGNVFLPNVVHRTVIMADRAISVTVWHPYLWEGALIILGYAVVFLAISILLYQRKEVKG